MPSLNKIISGLVGFLNKNLLALMPILIAKTNTMLEAP